MTNIQSNIRKFNTNFYASKFRTKSRVLQMLRRLITLLRILLAFSNFGTYESRRIVCSTLVKGNTKLVCQH